MWTNDRLIALEWADDFKQKPDKDKAERLHRWRPQWAASKLDPHDLEPEDPFEKVLGRSSVPDPVDE